ncbi:hypothetical protein SNEBB_005437 [Seison nebaliae]|nr:hypothetical protein SNEBB_005437 [Seison nebaliae]
MPAKIDPNAIHIVTLRAVGGEVTPASVLAPKIGPLGVPPKKVGEKIAEATKGEWAGLRVSIELTIQNRDATVKIIPSASALLIKALNEPKRDRKKEKNIKHNGNIPLLKVIEVAKTMRFRSNSATLDGTVREILGTAQSIGCFVDGRSPHDVAMDIKSGKIEV